MEPNRSLTREPHSPKDKPEILLQSNIERMVSSDPWKTFVAEDLQFMRDNCTNRSFHLHISRDTPLSTVQLDGQCTERSRHNRRRNIDPFQHRPHPGRNSNRHVWTRTIRAPGKENAWENWRNTIHIRRCCLDCNWNLSRECKTHALLRLSRILHTLPNRNVPGRRQLPPHWKGQKRNIHPPRRGIRSCSMDRSILNTVRPSRCHTRNTLSTFSIRMVNAPRIQDVQRKRDTASHHGT